MEYTDIELKNEKWKEIDGYEGMYEVSDLGRVRSKKYGDWRVRRPEKDMGGYLRVVLSKEGKVKSCSVHRLVAQAFIPNDDESKNQINHINEIKTDNRVSNLEWCTAQYNSTYNGLRYRQPHPKYKQEKLKDLYDPDISIKQNLELFKANGVECSRDTVLRIRKYLGLTRKHKPYRPRNQE